LRLEPTPFLCAMPTSSTQPDLVDPYVRELLPVTLLPAIVLAPLPLEDDHLAVLPVPDHLAGNRRALEQRRADPHAILGARHQHLVEGHRLSNLRLQRRYPHRPA